MFYNLLFKKYLITCFRSVPCPHLMLFSCTTWSPLGRLPLGVPISAVCYGAPGTVRASDDSAKETEGLDYACAIVTLFRR